MAFEFKQTKRKRDRGEMMRRKDCIKFSFYLVIVGVIFLLRIVLLFCPGYVETIRTELRKAIISRPNGYSVLCFIKRNQSFIGTAVWTLTTVLSAFMVFYYGRMSSTTYGVGLRKAIAFSVGSFVIPGSIGFTVIIVLAMTIHYYIKNDTLFYLEAISATLLQFTTIWECVFLTSDWHNRSILKKRERKQIKKGKDLLDSLVPIILNSEETIADKFELISQILICILREEKIEDDRKIDYVDETIGNIVKWTVEEHQDPKLLYDLIDLVKNEIDNKQSQSAHLKYGDDYLINRITLFMVCLIKWAGFERLFKDVFSYVDNNLLSAKVKERDAAEAFFFCRITLELIYQKERVNYYKNPPEVRRVVSEEVKTFLSELYEQTNPLTMNEEKMSSWLKRSLTKINSTDPDNEIKEILKKVSSELILDLSIPERAEKRSRLMDVDD